MDKTETIPSSGDRNLGPVLIGVNWAVFAPSTIIVCLRLITRIWITHNFGWDDFTIALAQAFNAVGMGFVMLEVYYGLGRHVQYLPPDHFVGFLKYNYLDWMQVFITLAISKISICLFLLRISKFERYRYFLFGLIAFLILSHAPLFLLYLLHCVPLNKVWDTQVRGYCFSKHAVEKIIIVQGVFSVGTDFIGAAFPIILLWNAKLSLRTKIALNLLMGLGIITGVVCIVRTSYSWEILSKDITWVGVGNALTRILEVNFGIIAACAPIMRPLYMHLHSRLSSHAALPSTARRTTPSQLQWFQPPTATPWYKRIFSAPAPTDQIDGRPGGADVTNDLQSSTQPPTQRIRRPKLAIKWPSKTKSAPKVQNPQRHHHGRLPRNEKPDRRRNRHQIEKPENVTWAKDDDVKFDFEFDFESTQSDSTMTMELQKPRLSDSFDLPLQGVRKKSDEEMGNGDVGMDEHHWGWA